MTNEKPPYYTPEQFSALLKILPEEDARRVVFSACSMNSDHVIRALENATLSSGCMRLKEARREMNVSDPLIETNESFSNALFALAKIEQKKHELLLEKKAKEVAGSDVMQKSLPEEKK